MSELFDQGKFSTLLKTQWLGKNLIYFESCDSTNEVAKKIEVENRVSGTVILSEHQSAGRGRWGRYWEGQKGLSLLMTLILPPPTELSTGPRMGTALGLGLAKASAKAGIPGVKLKWPNDLMSSGKKFGGMLMETLPGGLSAGIGLNLNQKPGDFGQELGDIATSIFIGSGKPVDREAFLAQALEEIEISLEKLEIEGFEGLKREWHNFAMYLGDPVRVKIVAESENSVEGTMMGLDSDGSLLIRQDQGVILSLAAGDLLNLRPVLT